jgi:thiosulfate dehydrogenase
MRSFIIGILVTVLAGFVGAVVYTRAGFAPIEADVNAGSWEKFLLGGAVDPAVERRAPHLQNPIAITDANLTEGMKLYVRHCASCHGGLDKKPSPLGQAFLPKAPQLLRRPMRDPEWQTMYVTQHGIRRTGMPGWSTILTDEQMWKMTAFLTRAANLPPAVQAEWQNELQRSATTAP